MVTMMLVLGSGCLTAEDAAPASRVDALPYYQDRAFTPQWMPAAEVPADFHQIPAFRLTDQHGAPVTEARMDGRVTVASFFFTSCGGICPGMTRSLAEVEAAFGADEPLLLLTHSVMPSTDSVPALRAFAARHEITSDRWHLLTGPRDDIYALGREAYFAEEDLGTVPDPDAFLHTESLILVDPSRHLRGVYNGLDAASLDQLIIDARTLLEASERR